MKYYTSEIVLYVFIQKLVQKITSKLFYKVK